MKETLKKILKWVLGLCLGIWGLLVLSTWLPWLPDIMVGIGLLLIAFSLMK